MDAPLVQLEGSVAGAVAGGWGAAGTAAGRESSVEVGQRMAAAVRPAGEGPAAELIFGDWYPALRAEGLKRGRTATTLLLGIPLLLGRKREGGVFAMRDLCPPPGHSAVGWVV